MGTLTSLQIFGIGFILLTMCISFFLGQKVYRDFRRNKSKTSLAFSLLFISWGIGLLSLVLERITLSGFENVSVGIIFGTISIVFSIFGILCLDLFASYMAFPKHVKKLMIIPLTLTIIFLVGLFVAGNIIALPPDYEISFPHYVRTSMLYTIFPLFLFPIGVLAYYMLLMRSRSPPHAKRAAWVIVGIICVILSYVDEVIGPRDTIDYIRSLYVLAAIIFYVCFTRFIELEWPKKIHRLYLCASDGICLYDHSFIHDKSSDLSPSLVTGFIAGIVSLVQEITQSKKRLKVVDVEDIKIILQYGKSDLIAILVSEESYKIIRKKLKKIVQEFEIKFETELANFKGVVNKFLKAKEIVDPIFYYEEQF